MFTFELGFNAAVFIGDTVAVATLAGEGLTGRASSSEARTAANSASTSVRSNLLIPNDDGRGTKNPDSRDCFSALLVLSEAFRMKLGELVSEFSSRPVHGAGPAFGIVVAPSSSVGIHASNS